MVQFFFQDFYSRRTKVQERLMAERSSKQLLCQLHLLPRKPHLNRHLYPILLRHVQRRLRQMCQLKVQVMIGQWKLYVCQLPCLPQARFLFNSKRSRALRLLFGLRSPLSGEKCQKKMAKKQGRQGWTLKILLLPHPLPQLRSFPSLEEVSVSAVSTQEQLHIHYPHPCHLWLLQ